MPGNSLPTNRSIFWRRASNEAAHLLYAEYRQNPNDASPDALDEIALLLRFLRVYPTAWQAFRDRARRFEQSIASEHGARIFAAVSELSDQKITETAVNLIPGLLAKRM